MPGYDGKICAHCKFWFEGRKECRRHAPTVLFNIYAQSNENVGISRFPQTEPLQWCGDYETTTADVEIKKVDPDEYEDWQYSQR